MGLEHDEVVVDVVDGGNRKWENGGKWVGFVGVVVDCVSGGFGGGDHGAVFEEVVVVVETYIEYERQVNLVGCRPWVWFVVGLGFVVGLVVQPPVGCGSVLCGWWLLL